MSTTTTKTSRDELAAAGLRRIRTPRTAAWGRGDAITWEHSGQRYRIRRIRRAWGLLLPAPVYHVLRRQPSPNPARDDWWNLLGRHSTAAAALRTLRHHLAADRRTQRGNTAEARA